MFEQNEEPQAEQAAPPQADPVLEYGSPHDGKKTVNPRGNIYYLSIIGHIEGHVTMPPTNKATKYEHVIPLLINVAESPEIEGLLIVINTVGGDVEAGLALAELISAVGKPSVSLVLGGGHSIGVPLAVSAEVSYIAPTATMTIHPVRLNGTVIGAPQTYDYMRKTQERITDFVANHSKMSGERYSQIMMDTEQMALDVGSVLVGAEAVREGLIDKVGGLYDAMEELYSKIAVIRERTGELGAGGQVNPAPNSGH